MQFNESEQLYKRAEQVIPGGVNSPVRAFKSVNAPSIFAQKAQGAHITDADGQTFLDYIMSWGPLILGHAREEVLDGVEETIRRGTSFGLSTELEIQLAELIRSCYPAAEMVRMVNSGTEATMSAVRAARAYTGRDLIVKF
ncbi:MAG TPA: hypothetical protein DHN33_10700, partial [Eubacteriaceae bacterium]|nr:hypothetical protein [Eubacteriaceae bacterium]